MRTLAFLLWMACIPGFAAAQGSVVWHSSFCWHQVDVDLTGYPSVRSLRLVLREWQSEEPLAGADVDVHFLSGPNGEARPRLKTNRMGQTRISLPVRNSEDFLVGIAVDSQPRRVVYETGPVELRNLRRFGSGCLMEPGETRATHRFQVLGNEALLELYAALPGAIEGVVRRPDGRPYAGVTVGASGGGFTHTDQDARYRFEELPPGEAYVQVVTPQRVRRTVRIGLFDPTGTFDLTWINQALQLERWYVTYPTYFPGVLQEEHAVRVPVHPNGTSVADIQVLELEVLDVVAQLWTPGAEAILSALFLQPTGANAATRPRVHCDFGGQRQLPSGVTKRYKCSHVPEGEYTLRAEFRTAGEKKPFVAETRVFVNRLTYDLPPLRLDPH